MKKTSILLTITAITCLLLGLLQPKVFGQTTKTVAPTGADYSTLQLAFAAINSGAITGQIILQVTGSTIESASAVLNASGTGSANYTSVLIYPTGEFSITATTLTPTFGNFALIDLNGADNVTIDGRINGTGSPYGLTFIGTSTGNGAAAIRYVNSAENNTIKYCNLSASSTSSSMGIVAFVGSSSGNGNDNNVVEYCNLTNSGGNRPYNGILSSGTGGRENNGCIIRNNNIYNTFQTGVSSNGININSASVGFTISGNSIYETTTFVTTVSAALSYNAIRVSTNAEHTVSGNYIGGKLPSCGGAAWSFTATNAAYFCGIYAYAGTGAATTISNNTIANIDFSSKEDNPWDGIFLYTGNFEVSGNTIGATTGINSIISRTPVPLATTTLAANPGGISTTITILFGGTGYTTAPLITFTAPPTGGTAPIATANLTGNVVTSITVSDPGSGYTSAPSVIFDGQSNNYSTSHGMIQNSTGTVNITGNNIGSITTVGSNYYSHGFESIYVRGVAATTTFTNNLIGSLTTPNSIQVSSAAASSLIKQDVYGIYSSSTLTTTISGNTVANLTNFYTGPNSGTRTRGIQTIAGSNTITNNTVFNISSASAQASGGSTASAIGISQTSATLGTTQTISGNTVYDIKSTNLTSKSFVSGIYYNGPTTGTQTISGNFVNSLSIVSSNNLSDMEGIELANGVFTCANNIVNIGGGIGGGYIINGIWDETTGTLARNYYFNTVYIGGSASSGTSITTAFKNQTNTGTRDFRNNIFYNARFGTGKHYAIYLSGNTSLTINYNDYYVTSGILGKIVNTEYATLDASWKTASGGDANSLSTNPVFTLPGGTSAINYYPSAALTGVSGTGITTDYFGFTRSVPPAKIGAIEQNANVWQGSASADFGTGANWRTGSVPASGDDIVFATNPTNDCILDTDRTVGTVTNGSSKNLNVNGHKLTVNGSLNFTSSGKVNTSTLLSIVSFAVAASQTIPGLAFESNMVAGLEIANSSGVALNGDLTISAALTLTSGILTVGANTLTISGTLTRTSGSINASDAGATLEFANTSALTLPASVFSADITNLTISGAGGLTASNDIKVNGVLNLAATNPSATKGLLEMVTAYGTYPGTTITNYNSLVSFTLYMGPSATTTGTGDVTGIVKRNYTIVANTPYSFGNQYTNVSITSGTTMPTALTVTITIGNAPAGKIGALKRTYEIVPTGGSGSTVSANFHYLDSELNNNTETKMMTWDYDIDGGSPTPDEHGRANYDFVNNFIGLANITINYFINESPGHTWKTIFALGDYGAAYYTWNGSVSDDWTNVSNWTVSAGGSGVPTNAGHVIIPNVSSTSNRSPILPSGNTTINTISIENGGILVMGTDNRTLTIANSLSGGWEDLNPSGNDPGNSKVIFSMPGTTISGTGRFYDVEIYSDALHIGDITNQAGSTMKIAGAITRTGLGTGKWYADVFGATVEYNGAGQTVLTPDGSPQYHNLTLSGSGIKTMTAGLSIDGNLTMAGTATTTAAGILTIGGNLVTEVGATFNTGAFSHSITGDIYCDGTITAPSTGSLTCTGNFYNTSSYTGASGSALTCGNFNNSSTATFSGTGSTLTCNGTFTNNNSFNGTNSTFFCKGNFINNGTFTSTGSTVTLNGTSAQSVEGTTAPSAFNNLTISNSQGVSLLNNTTTAALTISDGALLTVSATKNLTATGTTTLGSAQCLVLKSDAGGTASFIDNGTISGSGTAKVERYITPYDFVSDLKFHFLSSPVSSTQAIATEFIDLSSPDITDFYRWNEPTTKWISYRLGDYGSGGYNSYNSGFGNYNFEPGKGYMVAYPVAVTKNFVGTPSTGSITATCTHDVNGWNLIGNPYPSSVDWTLLSKGAGMDAALYYYDNAALVYKYYSFFSGGLAGASRFIAPMQGFMVHTNTGAPKTVAFSNTARTHAGQDVFYKDEPLTTNILDIKVESNNQTDYARVCFYEQATESFDRDFDAFKIFSYSPSTSELYSKTTNNTSLAINTLPLTLMDGGSVPLNFKVGIPGNFTLTAEKLNTFSVNTYIILEDKVTGAIQKLNDNPEYSFSATSQDMVERFVLHFKDVTSVSELSKPETTVAWYRDGSLNFATNEGITNVGIFNIQGQNLQDFRLNGGGLQSISLSLPAGVYFARLNNDGIIQTNKIIVQ